MQKTHAPSHRIFLAILSIVLLFCLSVVIKQFTGCASHNVCIWFEDFSIAYNPAHALAVGDIAGVYNAEAIKNTVLTGSNALFHPILYPPYSLFLFYPLGLLDFIPAECVWFSVHILLLLCVLNMRAVKDLFAGLPWPYIYIFFLPFCTYTLLAGQVGMLTTALFLLVIVWRKSHPSLSGIALAVLCFKPQLACALLVLLLREKRRVPLLIWAVTIAVLITASFTLWGVTLWGDYIETSTISALVFNTAPHSYVRNSSSFFMAAHMLGGSDGCAHLAQLGVSAVVLVSLWIVLKRCHTDAERLLLLAPATFLLSPYSFLYDTVLLAPACVILAARIARAKSTIVLRVLFIMLAALPIIAGKLQGMYIPYAVIVITLLYAMALFDVRKNSHAA